MTDVPLSCWRFWARYFWPRAAIGFVSMLVAVAIGLAIPHFIGRALDALLGENPWETIPSVVVVLLVLAVVQTGTRILGMSLVISVARDAENAFRDRLFAHLIRLDAGFHRTHSAGDIVSRLTNDMGAVVSMWTLGVVWFVGVGMMALFASVSMFLISPTLALWALLPMPLIVVGAQKISKVVKHRSGETQAQLGALSGSVQEDLAGIGVVRTYHLEELRKQRFTASSTKLKERRLAAQRAEGLLSLLVNGLSASSMFAFLWVGGSAAIDGSMSIGDLVQFSAYLALIGPRAAMVGDALALFQRGMVAWSRLASLLAYKPAIVDGSGPPLDGNVRGDLELRELTIEVDGRRLLDKVSLRIPAGTTCAIVGRVGSGKSTLLDALPRLIAVPSGMVFLDGRDITDLPLSSLRSAVAYAPQSPFLFSSSIAENIAFGLQEEGKDLDRESATRAAHTAGLTSDLASLPSGLDTQVGERGITVSGGQRQRIALARTLANAGDRRIVVLDDSLSSVDAQTEHTVLDNIDRELAGKTVVLVSHRVAAVRRAHQIAVLDQGKLVELGTHDELLARNGVYADLYRAQVEEETR